MGVENYAYWCNLKIIVKNIKLTDIACEILKEVSHYKIYVNVSYGMTNTDWSSRITLKKFEMVSLSKDGSTAFFHIRTVCETDLHTWTVYGIKETIVS